MVTKRLHLYSCIHIHMNSRSLLNSIKNIIYLSGNGHTHFQHLIRYHIYVPFNAIYIIIQLQISIFK